MYALPVSNAQPRMTKILLGPKLAEKFPSLARVHDFSLPRSQPGHTHDGSVVVHSTTREKSPGMTCPQNNTRLGVTAASGAWAGQEAIAQINRHAINSQPINLHSSLGEADQHPEGLGDVVIPPRPRDEDADSCMVNNATNSDTFEFSASAPGPSLQTRMGPNAWSCTPDSHV